MIRLPPQAPPRLIEDSKRFVSFKLNWNASLGKFDKSPRVHWSDPETWSTFAEARAAGAPAVVLTRGDGLACLDVDNPAQLDRIKALAVKHRLPCDPSVSGKGVHVWGWLDPAGESIATSHDGLELYAGQYPGVPKIEGTIHHHRLIVIGNAPDPTQRPLLPLGPLLEDLGWPMGPAAAAATIAPVVEPLTPALDAQALACALAMPRVADLWHARPQALARWSKPESPAGYDRSEALGSLAVSLLRWFQGDTAAVERHMRASPLGQKFADKLAGNWLTPDLARAARKAAEAGFHMLPDQAFPFPAIVPPGVLATPTLLVEPPPITIEAAELDKYRGYLREAKLIYTPTGLAQ